MLYLLGTLLGLRFSPAPALPCSRSPLLSHSLPPAPLSLVLLFLVFLTSCGQNYVVEETKEITSSGWTYADSLSYTFTIEDTLQIYDLHLLIEHTTDFPFQNLYVRLKTRFPDGQRTNELVSLELAGAGGNWLGECNNERCILDIPIQQGAYFNEPGQYELTIAQYTRRDTLPGVRAITFALEETENRRE